MHHGTKEIEGRSVPHRCKKRGIRVITNEVADVKMVCKGDKLGGGKSAPESAPKRNEIDEHLRRVYDDMLEDEVPSRFEELLRKLREQDDK